MSSGAPLAVGVVGAGHMGGLHARTYARLAGARLAGVFDIDRDRAAALAAELGCASFGSLDELAREVSAASVAVPTAAHVEVATRLIARGLDLLVEKPLAATAAAARSVVERAAAAKTLLMVGHSERFNPAVRVIAPLVRRPGFVEVHRLASFRERGIDVDVVLDLMIHDLDLLLAFVPSEVVAVAAVGVAVMTDGVDIANARLTFASGAVANLTASRVSLEPMRKVRLFERDLYASLDTQARTASAYRLVRPGATDTASARPRIEAVDLGPLPTEDPVEAELGEFIRAVRERDEPAVSGRDGLRAIELAERVRAAIEAHGIPGRD